MAVGLAAGLAVLLLLLLSTTSRSGTFRLAATAALPPQLDWRRCRHWASAEQLPGGCLGELQHGTAFDCCSGREYSCRNCSAQVLASLACTCPRHVLLRPAPLCGALLAPPMPPALWQPGWDSRCSLDAAAVWNGSWENLTAAETAPALPAALFHLLHGGGSSSVSTSDKGSSSNAASIQGGRSGGANGSRSPAACSPTQRMHQLGAAEVASRCLWPAGFDRVLVSGDSSVRQLYNRLVSLLRQQGTTVDGGGMQHAHYALQAHTAAAGSGSSHGDAQGGGGSSSSSNSSDRSSDGGGSVEELFFTDELWYSPTGALVLLYYCLRLGCCMPTSGVLCIGILHGDRKAAMRCPLCGCCSCT